MIFTILDGVKYKVISGDAKHLDESLPAIRADIQTMRWTQLGEQKWFHRKNKWDISYRFGELEVVVYGGKAVEKKVKQVKYKEDTMASKYVLLAELADGTGCVVFEPSNEMLVPTMTVPYAGASQDPLGIIDQVTNRTGWAKLDTGDLSVEQIKRVDQSYVAYAGDDGDDVEEVTKLNFYNNLWTYEDITFPVHWQSVDPGPPPESMCGYTWAPYPEYGGSEADYHTERYLFYWLEVGGKIVIWWPPEFNQKLTITQRWHQEGALFKKIDTWNEAWDAADQVGIESAVGDLILPESLSKVSITYDDSKRLWGVLWGNVVFPLEDREGNNIFPYTSYGQFSLKSSNIITDYARNYLTSYGIYVYNYERQFYIQGCRRWSPSQDYLSTAYRKGTKREEQIESDRFVDESYPRAPLTERQRQLLLGNEESLNWVFDPFTDIWIFEETVNNIDAAEVCINCGGEEFIVFQENGDFNSRETCEFSDYGIFTKEYTGIDSEGRVDPSTINPVYAYAFGIALYDFEWGSWVSGLLRGIYGLCLDGRNYISEEYEFNSDTNTYTVPVGGRPLSVTGMVRAGIKKFVTSQEFTDEIGDN